MSSEIPADPLSAYRAVPTPPSHYHRWHLYGAGLENVGRDGRPESVVLSEPGPGELLVRHDACGICYSDIKIINLGADHPRLQGRDLLHDPVVMGHEVALTVVKVGADRAADFRPGQRFIVQADVYYHGRNLAYGYVLTGGMSQYGLIGAEVLDGDEGCYLLPIADDSGYTEAALVEPWACVEAAYHWTQTHDDFAPGDVVFESTPDPRDFEARTTGLPKNAVVHLRFHAPLSDAVAVDVGRIHYDGWRFAGPKDNRRNELLSGGTAWFIGAAGPMGQMHVQRALQLANPPARLVCTDRQPDRLAALKSRLGPIAEKAGVELICLNIREAAPNHAALAPQGYDDIVAMIPSIEAIEDAFPRLGQDGVMNVFAGVARGTTARLPIGDIVSKNVRIVGTSGSTIDDMRRTRDLMESDRLDTSASLAAIGGLNAFRDGLDAVRNSRFPGKTVIFPLIEELSLTALTDLESVRPNVYAKLKDGRFWTAEAEAELLSEVTR